MSSDNGFDRWRPHPWHGLGVGPNVPEVVHAYIEMTPFDTVKYEIDKETGYLKVDRPQRYSSQPPALYGFIPRTYCGDRVDGLSPKSNRGDLDPLDICILSERTISRPEILLDARVIGGLRMLDHGEADDKIVGVLDNDNIYGDAEDISDIPEVLVERLHHYFLTYKSVPSMEEDKSKKIEIDYVYGFDHASSVIEASIADYDEKFDQ